MSGREGPVRLQTQLGPALSCHSRRDDVVNAQDQSTTLTRGRGFHTGGEGTLGPHDMHFSRNTRDACGLAWCRFSEVMHREQEGPQPYPPPRLPGHCGPAALLPRVRWSEERERVPPVYPSWLPSPHLRRRKSPNRPCRRPIASRRSLEGHRATPRSSRRIAAVTSLSKSLIAKYPSALEAEGVFDLPRDKVPKRIYLLLQNCRKRPPKADHLFYAWIYDSDRAPPRSGVICLFATPVM